MTNEPKDVGKSDALNYFKFHKGTTHDNVQADISQYMNIVDKGKDEDSIQSRKSHYESLISLYYNLVTDFYEYGWGESFHFAPRHSLEAFEQSIARAEHYLALRLGLKPGMTVLDLGAGVGGPMREIARFAGCKIIGVNISKYQITRGSKHNDHYGLDGLCSFIEADFHHLPFENESIDAVYAIEATIHSPDKVKLFSEINRVLKKGGKFASYEWCVTDKHDPNSSEHRQIKSDIEVGNALPELEFTEHSCECLRQSGFKVLEATDFGLQSKLNPIPWYTPLASSYSLKNIRFTWLGRLITENVVSGLEFLHIAPRGSRKTHDLLQIAAQGLVAGGQAGTFTPSYFVVGEKISEPLDN
jgi:sterol 24-C-methyltransferase